MRHTAPDSHPAGRRLPTPLPLFLDIFSLIVTAFGKRASLVKETLLAALIRAYPIKSACSFISQQLDHKSLRVDFSSLDLIVSAEAIPSCIRTPAISLVLRAFFLVLAQVRVRTSPYCTCPVTTNPHQPSDGAVKTGRSRGGCASQ
jgi:hypothetical protein